MSDALSTPTTTNVFATFFDGLIKAGISGGDLAAEAYITALDPTVLAFPVIAFFIDEIVQECGSIIQENMADVVNAAIFDVQTKAEASVVGQAGAALQQAESGGDQNAIAAAKQNLFNAIGSLVHSDGNAP